MPHQRAVTGSTSAQRYRRRRERSPSPVRCSTRVTASGAAIATGGMSTVYRGIDTRLDRPVAIKIMDARLAGDPAFRIRFEREARSAARIDHPAVVDVYDQGDTDRRPAVPRHGAGRRRHPARRAARPRRPRRARGVRRHGAGAGRARRGAPARDGAPRRQAGERADLRRPAGQGRRLRAGGRGGAGRGQPRGHDHGHGRVPVPRAGRHRGGRRPQRRLRRRHRCSTSCSPATPPYTGDTAISVAYRHVNCDVPAAVGGRRRRAAGAGRAGRPRPPGATRPARPADAAALLAELRAARRECWRCRGCRCPRRRRRRSKSNTPSPHAAAPPAATGDPRRWRRGAGHPSPPAGRGSTPQAAPAAAVRARRAAATSRSGCRGALLTGRRAAGVVAGQRALDGDAVARRCCEQAAARAAAHEARPGGPRHGPSTTSSVPERPWSRPTAARVADRAAARQHRDPRPCRRGLPTVPADRRRHARRRRRAGRSATPQLTPVQSGRSTATTVPEGAVVRTDPAAGTALPPADRVTLVLSRGERARAQDRQVRVPNLTGRVRSTTPRRCSRSSASRPRSSRASAPCGAGAAGGRARTTAPGSMVDRGHDDRAAATL